MSSSVREHFPWLTAQERDRLFHRPPGGVASDAPAGQLGAGLGATIYIPSGRPNLLAALRQAGECGAVAAVVCLEDSVATEDLLAAEQNLSVELVGADDRTRSQLPMLFVRPRTPRHLEELATKYRGAIDQITGACLPKFKAVDADEWFACVNRVADALGRPFLAMPILEGPEVLHAETRVTELLQVKAALQARRDAVVAVRIGATDLCGLLGLRRGLDETIYDLVPLASCIADIVNVFGRAEGRLAISGPVWEHFAREPSIWKPQLRESLFSSGSGSMNRSALRSDLIKQHLDGLIKETVSDRANGLAGKTVIHPSHVLPVNALAVPTHEEWADACSITARTSGVEPSRFGNKMNEAGPHSSWARGVLERAEIFGVLAEGASFVDIIDA